MIEYDENFLGLKLPLPGFTSARAADSAALATMLVDGLAADVGFVNLDNAAEFRCGLREGSTDFVAHGPSGFVRAKTHHPLNLEGAHTFLAGEHVVNNAKPIPQRLVGVLEDRPGDVREAVRGIGGAFPALPVPRHGRNLPIELSATTRTADTLGPAAPYQIGAASILVREGFFPLTDCHLMDALLAGHFAVLVHCREAI